MDILFIGIAGFIGALCRYSLYVLERSFNSQSFPYGTLLINLSGCFLAGLLFGLSAKLTAEQKHYITLILVGFVGSYTTFSTFSVETLNLLESKAFLQVFLNITTNIVGGIIMVWIGRTLATA